MGKRKRRAFSPEFKAETIRLVQESGRRSLHTGSREVIFVDDAGERLNQEAMHKRIFTPALRRAGVRHRGSYAIRDTFISHALSEGGEINAVAKFCGTSVRMIEKHYWRG
jgi:integrase